MIDLSLHFPFYFDYVYELTCTSNKTTLIGIIKYHCLTNVIINIVLLYEPLKSKLGNCIWHNTTVAFTALYINFNSDMRLWKQQWSNCKCSYTALALKVLYNKIINKNTRKALGFPISNWCSYFNYIVHVSS